MNSITIAGNVGKTPELRQLQSGDSILFFSVADNWTEKGEKKTTWYSCSIWGERAIKLQPHIKKGDNITVCGMLRPHNYTGREGDTLTSFDVRVTDVALQGSKEDADDAAAMRIVKPKIKEALREKAGGLNAGAAPETPDDFSDDDIPF